MTTSQLSSTTDFLNKLKGVKKSGDGWSSLCPGHADKHHSLSITDTGDKLLVNCHAGCDASNVVGALGLGLADLFKSNWNGKRAYRNGGQNDGSKNVEAIYCYKDAAGKDVFQTIRYRLADGSKAFAQRRGTAAGYEWNLKGVDRVPYRLPELLKADPEEIVFLPEGEKGVEAIIDRGGVATCNPCGAMKWPKDAKFNAHFKGRKCVVLADDDPPNRKTGLVPGISHANLECEALRTAGTQSVKLLQLYHDDPPRKRDVFDWFQTEGATLDVLKALAEQQPEWTKPAGGPVVKVEIAPKSATGITSEAAVQGNTPKPTDDELRDRWLANNPDTVFARDDFMRYEDGLWLVVRENIVKREIETVLVEAKRERIRPTKTLLNSVIELAKAKTVERDELFDVQNDHLVCGNGTLHIPTRTLGPWEKTHYLTRGVKYNYDPTAPRPAWDYFTDWLTNAQDLEIVEFLQEFAGLSITHDTHYEIAIWLVGAPGGGKSTLIEGIRAALSDRVTTLGLRSIERSRFGLSNLPGRTLATCTEQPGDYIGSTDVLNAIISGETTSVERKFHHPYDITPTVKLLWAMNEKPRISDPNNGIFRRVKIVEFPPIGEADIDPTLKERVKGEGAGILNWCLDGLDRLRDRGYFCPPLRVYQATKDYQKHADVPGAFLGECAEWNPQLLDENNDYREKSGDLYASYRAWALANGHKPVSSTRLADDWERLGLTRKSIVGQRYWYGVRLNSDAPNP